MAPNSKTIILFSVGFILVLCLIILLIAFTLRQFDTLQTKAQVVELEYYKKNEALTSFAQNSYKRTITLLKMYETSDPFERNELFDHFYVLAHKVANANRTFRSLNLPESEIAIHQKISQRMKSSSNIRSRIADLLLEGEDEEALAFIVKDSVQSQENGMEIIETLQELQTRHHNE